MCMYRVSNLLGNGLFFAGIMLLIAFIAFGPYLANMEAQWFPVASQLTIVSTVPDQTGIEVRYTYTKLRASCEYLGGYTKRGVNEIPHEAIGGDNPLTVGVGTVI